MSDEIWKDVIEFPELFMVSSHGRVWSKRSSRILKQTKLKTGYLTIASKIGGRTGRNICKRVHRWAAEAFIPNPESKPFVNHKDGDKENNHIDNLEWCTAAENTSHAYSMGLISSAVGEDVGSSKLTNHDVTMIRQLYAEGSHTHRSLGERFGVCHTVVGRIIKRTAWAHIA